MSAPRLLAPTTISGGIPVSGAGTLNTIAMWTPDNVTLGNSLLTQAGNVVTNASGAIRANGTTQSTPAFMRYDATNSGIYFPGVNEIGLTISGQHAMFISTGRNVGIGTASPSAKLDIRGAARLEVADPRFDLVGTYRSFMTQVVDGVSAAASYWRLYDITASANRIVCDAIGNVGIGTASPTATATIYKANNSLGAWNAQDLSVDGLSNGDAVYQRWYATGVAGAVGRFGVTFQSSVASFVWNSLFNSGVQTAELMRLTGGGNLGIGTASPSTRLHVSDNSSIPMIVQSSGSTDSYLRFINTANNLGYIGYVGTNLYLAPNNGAGNVGIGTASPQEKCQIYGDLKVGVLANGSFVTLADETSTQKNVGIARLAGDTGLTVAGYGGIRFFASTTQVTSQVERMRISNAGTQAQSQVAIGTSSFTSGCSLTVAQSIDVSQSAQGLKLPATPGNADTQTLDAYRENTFTPTIQGGTTAGVGTYTSQVGTFTIIGRCLFFNVEIAWSAHTGTGVVQLAGLPVAAAQLATFGLDSNYAAAGYLRMSAGNTYAQINTINVPATGNYRVSGCYFIA